jgi:hypothetical protein
MTEPVSWLVIEPGWSVVDRDGTEVGRVDELVGDTGKDIFSGLKVLTGLFGKARFVPAERVAAITEGEVRLDLSKDEVDRLEEFSEPPPSAQFRAP